MHQNRIAQMTCHDFHHRPHALAVTPLFARPIPLAGISTSDRIVKSAQHLFYAGDACHSIYLLRSGSAKMYAVSADGDEQVLGFYLPGDVVGVDAADGEQRSGAAVALETSSVCELPLRQLDALCATDPTLHRKLRCLYQREITRNGELLCILGKKDAAQRLAGFLLSLSRRFAERGFSAVAFNLSMTRHDIGHWLGLAWRKKRYPVAGTVQSCDLLEALGCIGFPATVIN